MRGNAQQNVRIQCGLLKHTTVPPYLTAKGVIIDWVKTNEYTKILEVPIWMDGEELFSGNPSTTKSKPNLPHGTHISRLQSQVAQC